MKIISVKTSVACGKIVLSLDVAVKKLQLSHRYWTPV